MWDTSTLHIPRKAATLKTMRTALALFLAPFPALAWDFSPDPVCTLTHQTADAEIIITYDAALPEYALFITLRDGTWPDAFAFSIAFEGGRRIFITTPNHELRDEGHTLVVRDTGFGNVLDGLEFNTAMTATSGTRSLSAPLNGAGPAVRAFRACPTDPPATS